MIQHCITCTHLSFGPQASFNTSSLVINGLDITTLDDDELYAHLKDLGSPVGPIVGECLSCVGC